jgi:antitoxin component YwqK of YwqJK toxin-antitoxin module
MNQYNKNKKHGYWEEYYSYSESIHTKGSYMNGEKHGYWEEYYSDGSMTSKGNYDNGQYTGYWEVYPMINGLIKHDNEFTLRKIFVL